MILPQESLYIHIPFCLSKCTYCDFFSRPFNSVPDEYVSALCNELKFRLSDVSSLKTVYLGGGTPSLLSDRQLKIISSCIPDITNVKEFTVEVNPDDVSERIFEMFEASNVTRISCGIQSLNDSVLKFCNRRADSECNLQAINLFEKYWEKSLSLDLISGLPYETDESFMKGLKTVTSSKADHISLYSLTIEDETPLGKMISSGKIDYDFDKSDEMWLKGRDFLESEGFSQYEVSNFCKKGKESIHNSSYWNQKSYIGCGSGGCGTLYKADGTAYRWTNTSNLQEYISFWNDSSIIKTGFEAISECVPEEKENVSKKDRVFEFFMMGLRTVKGVSKQKFENQFGIPFPKEIEKLFFRWEKDGLAEINEKDGNLYFTLGKKGLVFLNRFLQELLSFLEIFVIY